MKVSNITLYGGFDATVADSFRAKEHMDSTGVQYTNLFYNDPAQFPAVLAPVNSWFDKRTVDSFPFVVWDEIADDGSVTRRIAQGLKEIKSNPFLTQKSPTK